MPYVGASAGSPTPASWLMGRAKVVEEQGAGGQFMVVPSALPLDELRVDCGVAVQRPSELTRHRAKAVCITTEVDGAGDSLIEAGRVVHSPESNGQPIQAV
eukprot:CAMPEP_0115695990 /NCGR_PEP_ID=MMETSP0272-20121206/65051_1 /TAXON_ID=71861 /ORGANISM="Scrippsiella trochoidea, Strain CCMP3099" /LENGTH=100 /DNA_ID=CAMNT_0003136207 /DNA_START=91 /DNA_END=394 /DNA_ORIENTATION=-